MAPAMLAPTETKVQDVPEKTADTSSSYSTGVIEILKVMTKPFAFAMLSSLESDLTSLLQSKEKGVEKSRKGRRLLRQLGKCWGLEETTNDGHDAGHRKDLALGFGGKNCCAS